MKHQLTLLSHRPWTRFFVTVVTATSLSLGLSARPTQAQSLRELIFRGIQVIQISNLSDQQEIAIGAQMHQNLVNQGLRVSTNRSLNNYVDKVGQRLVKAGSRRNIPYIILVVEDDQVNAFATMGGRVYVTTGLLRTAANEAELASVIAHEIGHIEDRHLVQQIRQRMVAQGILAAATGSTTNQLANIGVELALNRPNSRSHEFEADEEGLRILRLADYATSAMPTFMRKLLMPGARQTPTFLSTHPAVPDRVSALEEQIASGEKNRCDRNVKLGRCGLNANRYQRRVLSQL